MSYLASRASVVSPHSYNGCLGFGLCSGEITRAAPHSCCRSVAGWTRAAYIAPDRLRRRLGASLAKQYIKYHFFSIVFSVVSSFLCVCFVLAGVQNQTDEISEDIQGTSTAIAGQGSIQSSTPVIIQEISGAEDGVISPTETSGVVQNQTDEIGEDIQRPSTAITGQGDIESPMPANDRIETKESSGGHKKKKRIRGKKEMLKLALMATVLGSTSTAFFAVNQHTYLDCLGMIFILCFDLAVVLTMLGKHYQSKRMERWGDHFTRATMVLMAVMVIAAAMLRKGGDIGTRGVQNNQELPRRLLKNLNGFKKYAKELDAKELSINVLAKKSSYTSWAEKWEAFKSNML